MPVIYLYIVWMLLNTFHVVADKRIPVHSGNKCSVLPCSLPFC